MSYFIVGFLLKGLLFNVPPFYQFISLLFLLLFFIYQHHESAMQKRIFYCALFYLGIIHFDFFIDYPVDLFNPKFTYNPQEKSIDPDFKFTLPAHTPPDIQIWLKSFLFNQASKQDSEFYNSIFKASGLLHVLVISGSHITMFFIILSTMYQLPLNMIHLTYPKFPAWIRLLKKIGPWFCLTWIWVYCSLVGFSPPIQRAFIMTFVLCCSTALEKKVSNSKLLILSFSLQILGFPRSIFSISTVLSWTSLLISAQLDLKNLNLRNIIHLFYLQFLMGIVILILCENFSTIGVFANILFLPLNGLVLIASIFAATAYYTPSFFNTICYEIIRFYLFSVTCFAEIEAWHFNLPSLLSPASLSMAKVLLLGLILKSVLNSFSSYYLGNKELGSDKSDGRSHPRKKRRA